MRGRPFLGPAALLGYSARDDFQALPARHLCTERHPSRGVFTDTKQGAKTQSQLVAHLDKATKEMSQGDYKFASQQIDRYLRDLADAVGSARITADDAAPVQAGAQGVLDCIAAIQ